MATSKARIYFAIVSRMRKANIPFTSLRPDTECRDCALVISSTEEAGQFGAKGAALEDFDENPGVFKGQVLSRLNGGRDVVLIGVDPGTRIGFAAFYGESNLEFSTFGSVAELCRRVGAFVRAVPAKKFIVRVGSGSPTVSSKLVEVLKVEASNALIEMVDESGTSVRRMRMKGIQVDQSAAAKIAFRKGVVLSPEESRTSG